MGIVETIEKYRVQEVLAGISGVLAWLGRKMHYWKQEQDPVRQDVLAVLHNRLYQACQYYLRKGYYSIDNRDDLEYMFRPYKALEGNETGEELYNGCLVLPYESESEGDNEKD